MSLVVDNSRVNWVVARPRPRTSKEEFALVEQLLAGVSKLLEVPTAGSPVALAAGGLRLREVCERE